MGQVKAKYWDTFNKLFETDDFEGCLKLLKAEWENLPNPKEAQSESYLIAYFLTDTSLLAEDFSEARHWVSVLQTCDLSRIDDGDREFMAGKVAYEDGDHKKAKELFEIANMKSGGYCFEDENPKYQKLLK